MLPRPCPERPGAAIPDRVPLVSRACRDNQIALVGRRTGWKARHTTATGTDLVGGVVCAYSVKQHNDQVASDNREAAAARADRLAKKEAAEKAAAAAAARQAADDAERKTRRELIG